MLGFNLDINLNKEDDFILFRIDCDLNVAFLSHDNIEIMWEGDRGTVYFFDEEGYDSQNFNVNQDNIYKHNIDYKYQKLLLLSKKLSKFIIEVNKFFSEDIEEYNLITNENPLVFLSYNKEEKSISQWMGRNSSIYMNGKEYNLPQL